MALPIELSGPELFLLYAWPCAQDRLDAGKITEADFHQLKEIVRGLVSGNSPDQLELVQLLAKCFKEAVGKLFSCKPEPHTESFPWNLRTVQVLWRENHGHTGDCAVKPATVLGIDGESINIGDGRPILNCYGLPIEAYDTITVHRRVAVEKL